MAHALGEGGETSAAEALAYAVAFGEMEGGTFSWSEMRWIERDG